MISCPACATDNSDHAKFCLECGTALRPEFVATITVEAAANTDEDIVEAPLSDTSHHGSFLPGTKIANRYRIVSLAGRGGMGEVYRADDIKLAQTVALKFLPRDLAKDPKRLEYFHSEVRLTRQISHPNVCRVYDIGEFDGQHFLSMEYVDGEDLRLLLRRIGRLPHDKGVEIAQQLCAGLAAAHARGVLHRDLKPANVMLDGHGQVRITDFGLARLASDGVGGEIAGTPAYMAPEQLAYGQTTVQSDLYSLGLILHELFTGKAVHQASSISDLIQQHKESSISQSHSVEDMPPALEPLIARCLRKEPDQRPKSAREVAAALPGGDPLMAALEAGETPSPEMVAAAGDRTQVDRRLAVFALVGVLICLLAIARLSDSVSAVGRSHLVHEPAVLRNDIRKMLTDEFGYDVSDSVSVDGFEKFPEFPDRPVVFWLRCRPPDSGFHTISFFQREKNSNGRPGSLRPPLEVPGELAVAVSGDGSLLSFRAIPTRDIITDRKVAPPNWSEWFTPERTGFYLPADSDNQPSEEEIGTAQVLEIVPGQWRPPPGAFDITGLWRGVNPDGSTFLVEAAAFRGKPTWFNVTSEEEYRVARSVPFTLWREFSRTDTFVFGMYAILLGAGVLLAWQNLRRGRGDRVGGRRLAAYVFAVDVVILLSLAGHSSQIPAEISVVFTMGLAFALYSCARIWIWYMALEPLARRFWPQILVTSSRLLLGQTRDPLVGRDLLAGCFCAVIGHLVVSLSFWLQDWLSIGSTRQFAFNEMTIYGVRETIGSVLGAHSGAFFSSFFVVMVLLTCRITLKTERRAKVAFLLLMPLLLTVLTGGNPVLTFLAFLIRSTLLLFLIVRFGLVALITDLTVLNLLIQFPVTADQSHWYFTHGMVAVASIFAIALYGFFTSLGKRPGVGRATVAAN